MKLLIVLAPLLLCWFVVPLPSPVRVVNCDDAEVHEAAKEAVHYININHPTGYKFALNRVENVNMLPSPSGDIYFLELDLLETHCPSVSPVIVENCLVRAKIEQAVEGDCDIKLKKHKGNFTVIGSKCTSELDSVENIVRDCPDCPMLVQLNDTQVVHAVDVSLNKFNGGNSTAFYLLHEIGRGKIQSGISNSVHVEFVIAASNCTKDDANSGVAACAEETGPDGHFGACTGSVVKNQGAVDEDVAVHCTIYGPQPGKVVVPQAVVPQVPVAPPQTNVVHSRFHHNLHHSNLGPHSSESNSAEHLLLSAQAKNVVKRSLTGEPVPPNVPTLPLCPGRKIHF